MHRLHLLRHAKSSRDEAGEDRDRPLTRSGREAARLVGETLPAAPGKVALGLCSSARRTAETAELALAGFAMPPRILFEDELYLAGHVALLRRLSRLDEADGTVLGGGSPPALPPPSPRRS